MANKAKRNQSKCQTYKNKMTKEQNKKKKLTKHLSKHLNDSVASESLKLINIK